MRVAFPCSVVNGRYISWPDVASTNVSVHWKGRQCESPKVTVIEIVSFPLTTIGTWLFVHLYLYLNTKSVCFGHTLYHDLYDPDFWQQNWPPSRQPSTTGVPTAVLTTQRTILEHLERDQMRLVSILQPQRSNIVFITLHNELFEASNICRDGSWNIGSYLRQVRIRQHFLTRQAVNPHQEALQLSLSCLANQVAWDQGQVLCWEFLSHDILARYESCRWAYSYREWNEACVAHSRLCPDQSRLHWCETAWEAF